ncbi:MAG: epoxyqueuosine reductase [Chloroflexi bacterium]|nr:epoxyqueuosine reductase [Chloroflexota bacterium]
MSELRDRLESKARSMGAGFFGIADLAPAKDFTAAQGGDFLAKYPRAVSIGYKLFHGVVDEIHRHEDPMALGTYTFHIYTVVNAHLDSIALALGQQIQEAGYRAVVVPASQTLDYKRLVGLISHKLAAHLAGLGWIGKSALLVTPESGPRVRWCTILTDAPVETDLPFAGERCGTCQLCVESCPVTAFTGTAYDVVRPRPELFAADRCWDYMQRRKASIGHSACGMCVYICPFGRKETPLPAA